MKTQAPVFAMLKLQNVIIDLRWYWKKSSFNLKCLRFAQVPRISGEKEWLDVTSTANVISYACDETLAITASNQFLQVQHCWDNSTFINLKSD